MFYVMAYQANPGAFSSRQVADLSEAAALHGIPLKVRTSATRATGAFLNELLLGLPGAVAGLAGAEDFKAAITPLTETEQSSAQAGSLLGLVIPIGGGLKLGLGAAKALKGLNTAEAAATALKNAPRFVQRAGERFAALPAGGMKRAIVEGALSGAAGGAFTGGLTGIREGPAGVVSGTLGGATYGALGGGAFGAGAHAIRSGTLAKGFGGSLKDLFRAGGGGADDVARVADDVPIANPTSSTSNLIADLIGKAKSNTITDEERTILKGFIDNLVSENNPLAGRILNYINP